MCSPPRFDLCRPGYVSLSSSPMDFITAFFHSLGISDGFKKEPLSIVLAFPHRGHWTVVPIGSALPTCISIGNPHPQHLIHLTLLISWYILFPLKGHSYIYSDINIVPYFVILFKYLNSSMPFLPAFLRFRYIFFSFFFLISFFFELYFLVLLHFVLTFLILDILVLILLKL